MGTELRVYAFNKEEVSVLLQISHSAPFPSSPFAQTPPGDKEINPAIKEKFIREGILDEKGITPSWKEIVDTISEPSWELTLIEGLDLTPRLTRYFPILTSNLYAGYFQDEGDIHQLSVFYTPSQIMEEVLRHLPGDGTVSCLASNLPFRELVASLSIIDLFRTVYLESYIERRTDFLVEFTPSDLYYIFEKGLETNDLRWCVTIGRIFSPQDIFLIRERVGDILKDMEKHGLVQSSNPHEDEPSYRLSDSMVGFCKSLLQINSFLAFKAQALKNDGAGFAFGLICGIKESALFTFKEVSPNMYTDISHPQKTAISRYMETVFQKIQESSGVLPANAHKICVRCSREIVSEERFCTFCGTAVASASPAETESPVVVKKKEEKKAQTCSGCKTENSMNAHFCRECGKKLDSDTMKACPMCNRLVKVESLFCRYCGFNFSKEKPLVSKPQKESVSRFEAGPVAKPVAVPISKPTGLFNCPSCNKQVRTESRFCRFCGHRFK